MAKYAQTNRRMYISQGRIRQARISSHLIARHAELNFHIGGPWPKTEDKPAQDTRAGPFADARPSTAPKPTVDPVSLNENRIHVHRFISSAGAAGSSSPTAEATARRSWFLPSRRSPFSVRCRANLHPRYRPSADVESLLGVYPPKNTSSRASERTEVIAARSAIVATKNGSGVERKTGRNEARGG